ncbi:MAG: hypothetical protein II840_13505 [Kiritimatiellae bacterium]|nr:hypothetical protein [Kiritimatiellia bacterium]
MNLLSMRKCSWAMSGAFVAFLTFAAHGSANVFDDAVFWFRGGKDISGDGYMQQGEFFDDLHANDPAHDNHKMDMSSKSYTGQLDEFKKNAVFQNEPVVFPALGTSIVKEMQVLHISDDIVVNNEKNYYFPFDVKPRELFARYCISNEYTVVSRIRLDDDTYNRKYVFLRLGYNDTAKQGMWLGFAKRDPNTAKYRQITGRCTPDANGADSAFTMNLPVPTNTWVDVAVVVGNGKLRVGIAAPESLSTCGDNPTIAFDETSMWTDNCTLLEDGKYRFFCLNGQTTFAQATGTDQTAFIGSVQQMAIWGRALTDQEVMEAFGMPRPAIFRTGFDNGDSNEFGGARSGSSQTIDGLGSWQGIWNTMKAGDTWTVNFNALRDEAGLPQIFSIKSQSDSATALIEPKLNNQSLGELHIAKNGRAFWPVPKDLITAGENTLVIERKNFGGRDFKMDAMELGGSLGVGTISGSSTDDGRVDPQYIITGVPSAADPNTQHWPTKLRPSINKDLHFRVWIDPDVVDKASFTLKTAYKSDANSASDIFTVYVNRNNKGEIKANTTWAQPSISLKVPVLQAGWNDIDFYSTATSRYWDFGYYRFETVLPSPFGFPMPPGMTVFIR